MGDKYSIGQNFAFPPEKKRKKSKGKAILEEVVLGIMNGFGRMCPCLIVEHSKPQQNGGPHRPCDRSWDLRGFEGIWNLATVVYDPWYDYSVPAR